MGECEEEYRPDKFGVVMGIMSVPAFGRALVIFEATEGGLANPNVTVKAREYLEYSVGVLYVPLMGEHNTLYVPARFLAVAPGVALMLDNRRCNVVYRQPGI